MAFRGQESALAAKWETYRDDVHAAELRAYEVDARVSVHERRVHELEQPVDARTFRVVLSTVVVGSIALAPALSPWRPYAGEYVEPVLGTLATVLFRAGPAILYVLLGRVRSAVVSLALRTLTLLVVGHFALAQYLPELLGPIDLLAIATVVECVRLLSQDAPLRRPSLPHVPALPQPPVGLDEDGWRRAVDEMERRVAFAQSRERTLSERAPRVDAHLEVLERDPRRTSVLAFAPSFGALGLLFAEQGGILGSHLLGLGVATLLLTSFPVSLRAWSRAGFPILSIAFTFARLVFVSCDPWLAVCEVQWAWLLVVCALEPGAIDASASVFSSRR